MIFPWSAWVAHSWEEDGGVSVPFSLRHGVSLHTTVDAYIPPWLRQCWSEFSVVKPLPLPRANCCFYEEVTMHSLHLRSGEQCFASLRADHGPTWLRVILQGDGSVSLLLAHICISIRLIIVGFGFILRGRFQCTLLGWFHFPILATRWSLSWYLPLFASFLSLWDLFCVSCQAYLLLLVSDSFIFLTQASNQPCLQGALIPVTGESHLTSASACQVQFPRGKEMYVHVLTPYGHVCKCAYV